MPASRIEIDWLGGNCPVQAEGRIDGEPFYFRARGSRWSLSVGGPDTITEPDWFYAENYGDGPFDAGWMPDEEAAAFIARAVDLRADGHPGEDCGPKRRTAAQFAAPVAAEDFMPFLRLGAMVRQPGGPDARERMSRQILREFALPIPVSRIALEIEEEIGKTSERLAELDAYWKLTASRSEVVAGICDALIERSQHAKAIGASLALRLVRAFGPAATCVVEDLDLSGLKDMKERSEVVVTLASRILAAETGEPVPA